MLDRIPTEADWRSEPWCADTPFAYKNLAGKSTEEAIARVEENPLSYAEDVMFMPTACMPFYARAYTIYLMSEASHRDSDGANAFFGVVRIWAEEIRADASLVSDVVACLEHLASRQEWYGADASIYGDFKKSAAQALSYLRKQQPGK